MAKKKAQKKHGKRHSQKQAQSKQSTAVEVSSTAPAPHPPKSRLLATLLVMMLVVSSTFVALNAGALSPILDAPAQKAQPELVKNTTANPFDELPEPPNYPTDMGYNASSGKFPPGALPPGVTLPGMSSYNAGMNTATIMDGRTTAQGYGVNDGIRQKFTGQIRDNESGLQLHGARYYNPNHGRFTSVDKPFAEQRITNPQSWNMYSYAGNNPLRYIAHPAYGSEFRVQREMKMAFAIKQKRTMTMAH